MARIAGRVGLPARATPFQPVGSRLDPAACDWRGALSPHSHVSPVLANLRRRDVCGSGDGEPPCVRSTPARMFDGSMPPAGVGVRENVLSRAFSWSMDGSGVRGPCLL